MFARSRTSKTSRRLQLRRRPNAEALEGRALMATLTPGPVTNVSRMPGSDEEVTIAVNPTNPNNLFAASIGGGAGQVAAVSFDGGASWASRIISNGSDGTPNSCCDASAAFDTFGNLFVTYLSDAIHTVVVMSVDGGNSFSNIIDMGSSDQPTIAVGPGDSPGTQSVWVVYNRAAQQFARGAPVTGFGTVGTFSAEQVAPDSDLGIAGNFGDIVIGPGGKVAIAYQHSGSGQGPDAVYANVDPDGLGPLGFGPRVKISDTNVGGFDFIPAQNRRSIDAEVGLAWDRAGGPNDGRLYSVYTGEPTNESNDTNIYVRFSDDNGTTWGPAAQVNDDTTTRSQFLSKIALDQTTGAVAVVWFDARLDGGAGGTGDTNNVANDEAILFGTVSVDGGATYLPNIQIGSGPSNSGLAQNNGFDFGDYIGLTFHAGVFHPIWPDNSAQLAGNPDRPNFDLATAAVVVSQLNVTALPVTAAENTTFSGRVANIDPRGSGFNASDFTADVNWSDGLVTPGTISPNGNNTFAVNTTRSFVEGGVYGFTVVATQVGSSIDRASGIANVADLPIKGTGVTFRAQEGDGFSGVVARFVDTDPDLIAPGAYTVAIRYGDDGSSGFGTVVSDPDSGPNAFLVLADHVFGGGDFNVTSVVTGPGGGTAQIVSTASVVDSPIAITDVFDVSPVEGQPFNGPLVRFVDADPRQPPASNYVATIFWGDGDITSGVISSDLNGGFIVTGDHAYEIRPTPYQFTVEVGNPPGTSTATATGDATIIDNPISVQALPYTITVGQSATRLLATFNDQDPRPQPLSRYAASIDWGDGTTSSSMSDPGLVRIVENPDGGFIVEGTHTYRTPGAFNYRVTVGDVVGGGLSAGGSILTVTPASISAQIVPTASPIEGNPFLGVVATFQSGNSLAQPGDFRASITWGDGTSTPAAAIRLNRRTGLFEVSGSKVYANPGTFPVSVVVTAPGDLSSTANGSIRVLDAPITAVGQPFEAVARTDVSVLVGTFFDSDPTPNLGDFSTIVVWGDGSRSPGQVVPRPDGGFNVVGTHNYARGGTYSVGVAVFSRFGASTTTGTTGLVSQPTTPTTGGLVPNGSSLGNTTNVAAPGFAGTTEPGATVTVAAVPVGQSGIILIGQGTADPNGIWSVVTGSPLTDGAYEIYTVARDAQGDLVSPPSLLNPTAGPVSIDTIGPQVRSVAVEPRGGQVSVTIGDIGTGLAPGSLSNALNFSLVVLGRNVVRTLPITGLTLAAATPGIPATTTLTFGGLGRLRNGSYVFQISAPGVTDLASNPLEERFFLPFPGLVTNNTQNFVAQFNVDGSTASPLLQFIPPVELTAAERYRQLIAARRRRS